MKYFLFILLAIILCCAILNYESLEFLLFDDAFYYLNMAKDGSILNPTTNNVQMTTGYHPLWFWSLDVLGAFSGDYTPRLLFILSSIIILFSFIIWMNVFKIFLPLHSKYSKSGITDNWAAFYSFLLHIFPSALFMLFSGLETPLVLATFGLFILGWLKQDMNLVTIGSILMVLSRTDSALIVFPILIYSYIYKREAGKAIVYTSAAILGFLYLNYTLTGTFLQTSGIMYAKLRWFDVHTFIDYFERVKEVSNISFEMFNDWFGFIIFLLPFGVLFIKDFKKEIKIIALGQGILLLFALLFRFVWVPWYMITYSALWFICVCSLQNRWPKIYIVILASIFLNILSVIPTTQPTTNIVIDNWSKSNRPYAQIEAYNQVMKQGYRGYIGAFNSGKFGYYCDNVVNLDGLMNVDIVRAYEKNKGCEWLANNRVELIVDYDIYYNVFNNFLPIKNFKKIGTLISEKDESKAPHTVVQLIRR